MLKRLIVIGICYYFLSNCLSIADTKISTNRNSIRSQICAYYNATFSSSQKQQTQSLIKSYNYLSTQQIQKILFSRDFRDIGSTTYLYLIPHFICVAILIVMIPGLTLCCVKPQTHPNCKQLRKQQKQMYTRCQLKLPVSITFIVYIIIIAATAASLANSVNIINHYNNINCKIVSIADDTLYGRISTQNQSNFYIGIIPLSTQLKSFVSSYNTFYSQSQTSLSNSQQVRTQQTVIQNAIVSQYTNYVNPIYTNAFRQSDGTTYVGINSQFKDMYYGPVTNNTVSILGNIYYKLSLIFTQINTALDPLITSWLHIQSQTQLSTQTYINNTIANISTYQLQLNSTIQQYSQYNNNYNNSNTLTILSIILQLIYGIIISISILGIISTIILCCCVVVRIRLIMYFTCTILYIFVFITFIMLIIVAVLLPTISQSCMYVDNKLLTNQGIIYIIYIIGTVDILYKLHYNQSAQLYTYCNNNKDINNNNNGDMITSINNQYSVSYKYINNIAQYAQIFTNLIPNFTLNNLQIPFTQAATKINTIMTARLLQINSSTAIQFLNGLALKLYPYNPSCNNIPLLDGDSWVPSRTVINCQPGKYAQLSCNDLSDTNICPQGCYQFYDQLTDTAAGDSTSYGSHLYTRYGTGCNYADYIIDLHRNWTLPKISNINTVNSNIASIQSQVSNYQTKVATIQGNLQSFKSTLQQNFNSQFNLTSGSFYGNDCKVIGQSINQLRDALCVGFLGNIRYNFIFLCLISYGITLLACLTVCTGVRHYKHLLKMQIKIGYKGVPVSLTQNKIQDKSYQ